MNVKEVLGDARKKLTRGNIEDAVLEAEILLRDTLEKDRAQLYLALDDELSPEQQTAFRTRLNRRLNDEPTAYILGYREFYGRDFIVSPAVLIPRPETELLVEAVLRLVKKDKFSVIAEVGTGCGAIAVSLALELPYVKIYATDISVPALEIAKTNSNKHGVAERISFMHCDLLGTLPELPDIVVANMPYIRKSELPFSGPVSREPRLALDGGNDGLEQIRRLCRQVKGRISSGGYVLLEVGQGQAVNVKDLLKELLPATTVDVIRDLAGIDRVISFILP